MQFGHTDDEWAGTKRQLRTFLIATARKRSVVPYSQVVKQIGPIRFSPDDYGFHRMLDETSVDEDANGRGLLTVVVVHKDGDMQPGPGFFELARDRGRQVANIEKTWINELKAVWRYWKDH
jgi:hypothetical protein